MSDLMYFNGINGESGDYLLPPMQPEQLSAIIQGEPEDEFVKDLKGWHERMTTDHFAVEEGVDVKKLEETGWGIIFPHDCDPAIIDALQPLIQWRQSQAASQKEQYFKLYTKGEGYRPNENKNAWLTRHGAGPGPADPDKVPYYLLLVGDPEKIPYRFQTQLDVQYAVGRICFDTVEEYANYAQSVVAAEKQQLKLARRTAFFGVGNPDDAATRLSSENMIFPLAQTFREAAEADGSGWQFDMVLKDGATKAALAEYLGGPKTPALLYAASHGMSFPNGNNRQLPHQGALLCQDWPGPKQWRQPIPEDFYFSADDLSSDAKLWGTIGFFFACYGGGTPYLDEFAQQAFKSREPIAPRPFIARLPQRMLSHPKGGALAVIGHVERAWGYSFMWGKAGKQLAVFESVLNSLYDGKPIGAAFEYLNQRYAELSSDLSVELEEVSFGKTADAMELSGMWTANNDARNYVVLGDPAVRMMVGDKNETVAVERPSITLSLGAASIVAVEVVTPVVVESASFEKSPVLAGGGAGEEIVNYGILDTFKAAPETVSSALTEFGQKLGAFLSAAIEDASTLKVSTYVSDNLSQVKIQNGELTGANMRALTYIKIDGDTLVCVPQEDGEVDTTLWNIHVEMVKQAQASRTELIKAAVSAASSLGGVKL